MELQSSKFEGNHTTCSLLKAATLIMICVLGAFASWFEKEGSPKDSPDIAIAYMPTRSL